VTVLDARVEQVAPLWCRCPARADVHRYWAVHTLPPPRGH
jgi:hypothetical protein